MKLPPFYPLLDTGLLERRGLSVEDAAEAVLEGGARILQFRHKGLISRETLASIDRIAELCHRAGAALVMNDRADVAMLAGTGLHVGQDDLPAEAARGLLGAGRTIGLSTHNEAQLRAAATAPVDYVALGPLFATSTKDNPDPVVGLDEFRRLRAVSAKPMVAIGGITRENAAAAMEAGADSLAVISDLLPDNLSKYTLRLRTEEWVRLLKA